MVCVCWCTVLYNACQNHIELNGSSSLPCVVVSHYSASNLDTMERGTIVITSRGDVYIEPEIEGDVRVRVTRRSFTDSLWFLEDGCQVFYRSICYASSRLPVATVIDWSKAASDTRWPNEWKRGRLQHVGDKCGFITPDAGEPNVFTLPSRFAKYHRAKVNDPVWFLAWKSPKKGVDYPEAYAVHPVEEWTAGAEDCAVDEDDADVNLCRGTGASGSSGKRKGVEEAHAPGGKIGKLLRRYTPEDNNVSEPIVATPPDSHYEMDEPGRGVKQEPLSGEDVDDEDVFHQNVAQLLDRNWPDDEQIVSLTIPMRGVFYAREECVSLCYEDVSHPCSDGSLETHGLVKLRMGGLWVRGVKRWWEATDDWYLPVIGTTRLAAGAVERLRAELTQLHLEWCARPGGPDRVEALLEGPRVFIHDGVYNKEGQVWPLWKVPTENLGDWLDEGLLSFPWKAADDAFDRHGLAYVNQVTEAHGQAKDIMNRAKYLESICRRSDYAGLVCMRVEYSRLQPEAGISTLFHYAQQLVINSLEAQGAGEIVNADHQGELTSDRSDSNWTAVACDWSREGAK